VTKINALKYGEKAKVCKKIVGLDCELFVIVIPQYLYN